MDEDQRDLLCKKLNELENEVKQWQKDPKGHEAKLKNDVKWSKFEYATKDMLGFWSNDR